MPRNQDPPAIRPSLLDRLIDEDPASEVDPPVSSRRQLRELRLAIRRDLENLLNTRRRCLSHPEKLAELEGTILEYGVPDLSATKLASDDDQEDLLDQVEGIVRQYEPRFKSVKVEQVPGSSPHDRTVRFKIDAMVYADPVPEEVVYDSAVEPVSRGIEVKADSHD